MAVSDSRLNNVHAKVEGIAEDRSQPAQRPAKTEKGLDARTPSVSMGRLFATVFACAACFAMVSYWACTGNRAANPAERGARVGANRQPLTLGQTGYLDQETFERSLLQLQQVMDQPSHLAVADQETLTVIANKLRQTDESTRDYWPTVLRFLQFASLRMARNVPPPGQRPRALSDILFVGLMRGIREEGKTILLDGGDLENAEFIDCRIIFTENPVRMKKALFRNCAFEIPIADSPTPYIRKVSQILLSSNLGSVSIPTL